MQRQLHQFLLAYRSTTHATTGATPAKLFLGREIRTRLSLVKPNLQDTVMQKQSKQKEHYDAHSKYREFFPGDEVIVKDMRSNDWWPGTIAERSAPKSYIISLKDGRVWKRHVDQVRRTTMDNYHPTSTTNQQLKTNNNHPPTSRQETTTDNQQETVDPSVNPSSEREDSPTTTTPSETPTRQQRNRRPPRRLIQEM